MMILKKEKNTPGVVDVSEALTLSLISLLWSCRRDGHRQIHVNGHIIQHQI